MRLEKRPCNHRHTAQAAAGKSPSLPQTVRNKSNEIWQIHNCQPRFSSFSNGMLHGPITLTRSKLQPLLRNIWSIHSQWHSFRQLVYQLKQLSCRPLCVYCALAHWTILFIEIIILVFSNITKFRQKLLFFQLPRLELCGSWARILFFSYR